MYYTTNKATPLYNIGQGSMAPTDLASLIAGVATQLPQGSEVKTSADPPKIVFGSFVEVVGTSDPANGIGGYVALSDLTQETLSKTQKLGVGLAAVVLGWLFFFKK